jgi:hypothetical protein
MADQGTFRLRRVHLGPEEHAGIENDAEHDDDGDYRQLIYKSGCSTRTFRAGRAA